MPASSHNRNLNHKEKAMSTSDPPIVITGGSVEIEFNEALYTGANGKYGNERRKIVRVEVVDDNTGQAQTVQVPANGKCTVRIHTQ
jgi:hypothetical protein